MKKVRGIDREEISAPQNIGGTLFVFVGFVAFILVFASLGGNKSFRESNVTASLASYGEVSLSEQNETFLDTYMPYFEYFALHYTNTTELE
jgi:hypothetical protein